MSGPSRRSVNAHLPSSVLAYDIETIAPPVEDGSFPPWPTHRPIAIGFASAELRDGEWTFDLDALVVNDTTDEAALIREADGRMSAVDVVTSYNGRGFDALVLRLAAQKCREWQLKALARHAAVPRFDSEHMDLADLYASFGRKVSLSAICNQVGIPVKTDVGGADVANLWAAGESDRIRKYVLEDSVATLSLYFAFLGAQQADEALIAQPLAALARHIESTPALGHLHSFVDGALTRWARPRAMKASISAALAEVQCRFDRQQQERAFVRQN